MQMSASHTGLNYTVHVVVTKVGTPSSTNMKLVFYVTQSNIPHSWGGGLTTVDHINMLMVPDQNGTTVDFSSGNTQSYDLNFTADASWPLGDIQVVAFVQDWDTHEVLQGEVSPLLEVGVNEPISNNFNLNVYPNPINSIATIAFDLKESSNAILNIYDIVGKNVYSNNLGMAKQGVNLVDFDGSKLNAGMYIVKLTVNNQTITKKITISK